MSTRTISGAVGLIATAGAIYLETHGHQAAAQCFIWSVFALGAPVGVALVTERKFLSAWFLVSLIVAALLHGLLLWRIWYKFPFHHTPATIVFGAVEGIILGVLCAQIKEWMGG
jgi:hypothetical protein